MLVLVNHKHTLTNSQIYISTHTYTQSHEQSQALTHVQTQALTNK